MTLTIDVKTKAVLNRHEHTPIIRHSHVFGRMDQTPGYVRGWLPPNYPVPSTLGVVRLAVYPDVTCIDTPTGDDWVIAWDTYLDHVYRQSEREPRFRKFKS